MNAGEMKHLCERHLNRYVELQAANGACFDGIVESVDDHTVCLAVPGAYPDGRAFVPGPFFGPGPFGPFGVPYGPGFFPFRPRRFGRLALPLAGLLTLSLLPYYY